MKTLTKEELTNNEKNAIRTKFKTLAELSSKNKVLILFMEQIKKLEIPINLPSPLRRKEKKLRKKLVLDLILLDSICKLAKKHNIELVVVKTIKPFIYVGDDIDLLVEKSQYKQLIKLLKIELNLKVEGWGPAETTLYKYVKGVNLMVDVHYKLAASSISYVNTKNVLKSKYLIKVRHNDVDIKLPIPSIEYSTLITAAHAILKELRINLADILDIHYRLRELKSRERLIKLAETEGLTSTLNLTEQYLKTLIGGSTNTSQILLSNVENNYPPYKPNLLEITKCYIEKITKGLQNKQNTLNEIIKLPLTNIKGIGIILRYIKAL
jgi:hypothetical protein